MLISRPELQHEVLPHKASTGRGKLRRESLQNEHQINNKVCNTNLEWQHDWDKDRNLEKGRRNLKKKEEGGTNLEAVDLQLSVSGQ